MGSAETALRLQVVLPFPQRQIMRPAITLLFLAVLSAPLPGQHPTVAAEFAGLARYRDENAKLPATESGRVVFMGNSITEGWAPLFAKLFPGRPYVGRGISGQ